MVAMRARGTGTFDTTTKTWRLRGRGIQVSVRQLSERYGWPVEPTKAGSIALWRRFLQETDEDRQQAIEAASPLQHKIKSLKWIIDHLKKQSRPTADLERLLREAVHVPAHDIDHADLPVVHPDRAGHLEQLRLLGVTEDCDHLTVGVLNSTVPPTPTDQPTGSLRREADNYVAMVKTRGNSSHYEFKQVTDLLLQVTGDIRPDQLTVDHWRRFKAAVEAVPTWNATTQAGRQRQAKTFLRQIECDYNLRFGWLYSRNYRLPTPEGHKKQWTIEQVKYGLQHATGDIRLAMLLGLNCGFYWSDIFALKPDMIQGDYVSKAREKNLSHNRPTSTVGTWRLWPETKRLLHFNGYPKTLDETFLKWTKSHDLPDHKSLRKTTTQIIHDHVPEDQNAARLFRCEVAGDNHGRSYIRSFTPEQVKRLDYALHVAGRILGVID